MARTAQILLLLLLVVVVQSYGGRRYFRGRSHKHRNPDDNSHHRRHGDVDRPRDDRHDRYPNRHHHSLRESSDSEVPDDRPQYSPDGEGSIPTPEQPPLVDPVPDNNPTPGDNGSSNSGESDHGGHQDLDLTGADNDKPDDVANINNPDEDPDHAADNSSGEAPSSGENPDNTENGSNEQPVGDGSINGLSPGNVDENLDDNVGGNIGGSQPNLDIPTDSVSGEPDEYDDEYLHNGNNIDHNKLSPNGGDGYINGHARGDNNEQADGADSVNNGDDDDDDLGHGSENVNGLSPVGDVSKPNDNNTNNNGFSPGGDHADHGHIIDHGGLPSEHLGDASVGVHGDLPVLSGQPDSSGLDPNFIQPHPGLDISGGMDPNMVLLDPHGIDQPQVHPTFPGNGIIPGIDGRPDEIPSLEIPGQSDNNSMKNNSMLIPVLLPGGGHILVQASALGNIPSFIIVMINGQPTLIQNPGGLGIGGGNNGLSIGDINGGAVLPSWLAGIGNGGASIGGDGIGILPNNVQPIWIGPHLPNFGGGGVGGQFIIPTTAPIQPVPVPIPRPLPPSRPIYQIPQPIPMPGPGLNFNTYPGFPWPPTWKPSNPGSVNVNLTHNLLPNEGSNIDWNILLDLLANIDSRLPKPQPPQPKPLPTPNYPSYPYPQYPYPYPPPYPYLPYPYPPNYPYPSNNNFTDPSNPHPADPVKPLVPGPGSRPDEPLVPSPGNRPDEPLIPGPGSRPEEPLVPGPGSYPEEALVPGPGSHPEEPLVPGPGSHPEEPLVPGPGSHPEEPLVPGPGSHPEEPLVPGPGSHPEGPLVPGPGSHPGEPLVPGPGSHPEEPLVPGPGSRPEEPLVPGPGSHPEEPLVPGPGSHPEEPLVPGPGSYPEEPLVPGPGSHPEEPLVPGPGSHPEEPLVPGPGTGPEVLLPNRDPTDPSRHPNPVVPHPKPEEPNVVPNPKEPPVPKPDEPPVRNPDEPLVSKPGTPNLKEPISPKPHPGHPDHRHPGNGNTVINLPDIHITLPKPTHIGKPKPGLPGPDSGLIDILNVLLKFPDRNSHPPKNLGPLIKLLLAILKPGEKNQINIPSLNENKGQPDLGNLAQLIHLLDDHNKEPNLNVLVEPGMDEGTRAKLILLLQLLANNLGGGSYPSMGYYQPENPLLYFLGHFPCDHPNFQAISGMQSGSNLWQLLANMYGHNYGQEQRLYRSAEETDGDDKSDEAAEKTDTKLED